MRDSVFEWKGRKYLETNYREHSRKLVFTFGYCALVAFVPQRVRLLDQFVDLGKVECPVGYESADVTYSSFEILGDCHAVAEVEILLVRHLDQSQFVEHERAHGPQWDRRQLELFALDLQ